MNGDDSRKIVVIVEDVEASRSALLWALHNIIRYGDIVTLLHVSPSGSSTMINSSSGRFISISKKKRRLHRLKGFQLALSFKDICNNFPNAKIEIIVTEGEDEGATIVKLVRQIGASTLVVGLHDHSFLYRLSMVQNNIASNFNCKVLAINQQTTPLTASTRRNSSTMQTSTHMDFSHIQITNGLRVRDITPPKVPYRICPNPSAIIWRSRKTRRKRSDTSSA